ncbi:unnamed protein product, partial [Laminaria digitata]
NSHSVSNSSSNGARANTTGDGSYRERHVHGDRADWGRQSERGSSSTADARAPDRGYSGFRFLGNGGSSAAGLGTLRFTLNQQTGTTTVGVEQGDATRVGMEQGGASRVGAGQGGASAGNPRFPVESVESVQFPSPAAASSAPLVSYASLASPRESHHQPPDANANDNANANGNAKRSRGEGGDYHRRHEEREGGDYHRRPDERGGGDYESQPEARGGG